MITWGCMGFEGNYLTEMEKRGIAILVGRDSSLRPEFVLQVRSIDLEMENQLANLQIPISLTTRIWMRYCPWCGTDLEPHYRKVVDQLIAGVKRDR